MKQRSRSKADTSYIALIARAILCSPSLRCCLKDIYSFIEEKFPQLPEKSPNSWRNSVRHNLSLNECFIKSSRCENGKGNYWTIHPANLGDFFRGDFRRRKAKARIRISTTASQQQLPLQCTPCVRLIPVIQLPRLQQMQASTEHPSARSETEDSSFNSEVDSCTDVETLDASGCQGEGEGSLLTHGDCSDEGSESEDSGVVFVGQEKMEDTFLNNAKDAKLETRLNYDAISSPPAKRLKLFTINNILSHKTRQGRIEKETHLHA